MTPPPAEGRFWSRPRSLPMSESSPAPLADLSRLCVHTITTKPWSIEQAALAYACAGVKGITVWADTLTGRDPARTGDMLRGHGLSIVSLCRGGFFPYSDEAGRQRALD